MKFLQLALIAAILSLSTLSAAAQSDKDDVRLEINGQTTMLDLSTIKSTMLDHGAFFQMKDLTFDDDGFVQSIHVTVNFNDGFKGEANMLDFSNGKKLMIIRNHSEGAKTPFCIGQCE
jgi:hypothetical protein